VHFLKRELAPNKIQLDLNFNAAESLANTNSYFPSAKKLRAFEKKIPEYKPGYDRDE
jgi:hypothetical protein